MVQPEGSAVPANSCVYGKATPPPAELTVPPDETTPVDEVTVPDESEPVDATEPDWTLETDAPQATKPIANTAIIDRRKNFFMRSPWRVMNNPTTIRKKNPGFLDALSDKTYPKSPRERSQDAINRASTEIVGKNHPVCTPGYFFSQN